MEIGGPPSPLMEIKLIRQINIGLMKFWNLHTKCQLPSAMGLSDFQPTLMGVPLIEVNYWQ